MIDRVEWCDRRAHTLQCHYALTLSEVAFLRAMRRLKVRPQNRPPWLKTDHSDATTHWFESTAGVTAIVCLRRGKHSLVQVNSLLVHEAVHIWRWHCEHIGEDEPSSEFEAYGIQQIAQNLMLAYYDLTRPVKH